MTSYIGHTQVSSPESLQALIERYIKPSNELPIGHFLRWAHQVSGMRSGFPSEFSSTEGQVFNPDRELRWKRQGENYAVLLLSQTDIGLLNDFHPLPGKWQTETKDALCHDLKNPQYPNKFQYEEELASQLCQRFFRNEETGTVHFVALTLK
jgi:hypothetical protein